MTQTATSAAKPEFAFRTVTDGMRAVRGYEGLYSVTSDGRVFAHQKVVTTKHGRSWTMPAKYLKPIRSNGYSKVTLYGATGGRSWLVHRLVADAWLPAEEGRPFINHKDSNRANNDLSNLEWCTTAENNRHGWREGGRKVTAAVYAAFEKAHAARRRFTEAQVLSIRKRVAAGVKQKHLAAELGVCPATICQIVKGRNYQPQGAQHGKV